MPDNSVKSVLENLFSKSDKSDWEKIATHETRGKDPLKSFSWHGKDEINFLPYYDAQDVADLQYLKQFLLPAAESGARRTWLNVSPVSCVNETKANALVLQLLAQGSEGICFYSGKSTDVNLDALLKDVVWPYCFISFYANAHIGTAALPIFIKSKFRPDSIHGALFWESIPKKNSFQFYFDEAANIKALGLIIPTASPVKEIAGALLSGVHTVESFKSETSLENIFRSVCFSLTTDAGIFESAAKLKALRMLWLQVARSYGQNDYNMQDVHIHARSKKTDDGAFGPHENMLHGTFSAMAAILGGCDSLTVEPGNQSPDVVRWAKNVSPVFREESFFDQVPDALAGAYAIDTMVDAFAQNAWAMFQQNVERP
jgi:methylmalonyl-CoA mutase